MALSHPLPTSRGFEPSPFHLLWTCVSPTQRTWCAACQVFPKLEPYIVHTSVGTPLSTNNFLGTSRGECYGRSATPGRWLCPDLSPYTPVTNLLLTGQDVVTLGLTGGIASGYLTANVLAGYGAWENILLQREVVDDLGLGKIF